MKFIQCVLLFVVISFAAIDIENPVCEEFTLGAYLDARYEEFGSYNAVPSRGFSIRRAGLEASALITGNLQTELKIEFRPDEVFLKDALVEWGPLNHARARFGLFRRATLLGGDLSTWDLPLFERPLVYELRENLTYSGRDLGFDACFQIPVSDFLELEGTAGIYNGDARAEEREDSELLYSFRGTAQVLPADLTLGLSAVSHRKGLADLSVPDGYISSGRLYAFSGDLSLEHEFSNWYGASLYAELSTGDNWELCDVLAGEDPPSFLGYWGTVTFSYHPWNVQTIRTISLSLGYDEVKVDTDLDWMDRKVSVIGALYPTDDIRLRFGGVMNTSNSFSSSEEYTDIILEAGFRF